MHSNDPAAQPPSTFDGVATITAGDAFFVLWKTAASNARIRWVNERVVSFIDGRQGDVVAAQFLLPSASPPGLREVSAVRESLRVVLPRARRLVAVPLGDAAWQSVVRSVMRAGLTILGQSERIKVASSPREAFTMLSDVASSDTPAMDRFESASLALFAALGERPPAVTP